MLFHSFWGLEHRETLQLSWGWIIAASITPWRNHASQITPILSTITHSRWNHVYKLPHGVKQPTNVTKFDKQRTQSSFTLECLRYAEHVHFQPPSACEWYLQFFRFTLTGRHVGYLCMGSNFWGMIRFRISEKTDESSRWWLTANHGWPGWSCIITPVSYPRVEFDCSL